MQQQQQWLSPQLKKRANQSMVVISQQPIQAGANYLPYGKRPPETGQQTPSNAAPSIRTRSGSRLNDNIVVDKPRGNVAQGFSPGSLPNSHFVRPPSSQLIMRHHHTQDHDFESPDVEMDEGSKLVPLETDFMLADNKAEHRTQDYELQGLVLRRGQAFRVGIKFDKPYDSGVHKIFFQFTLGSRSLISKGTHIRIPVDGVATVAPGWCVRSQKSKDPDPYTLVLSVESPSDALVGRYKMYIETQVENAKPSLFRYTDEILLIFNPFVKSDVCFMPAADLEEYLMNEKGVFYTGTEAKITPKHWHLGQFQFPCLEIALWLLERANLPHESRGDPMQVVRAMSAMINGGDRGVISVGAAASSPPQPAGFQPNEWAGSVKIVKKFMEQRGQPVKNGNCYTFAAVLCTMCRAIGLPCRIVTGFRVAHDCDMNSTLDVHWDKNHRPIGQLNKDVVWTHHSWNEVWFSRKDIPEEMNGWEAVDSTSNSASESLYRLGPCPVKAISSGNVSILYDSQYISACLNNYRVHWIVGSNGEMSPIGYEKDALAPLIVTKSVGTDVPLDITGSYKYPSDASLISATALARRSRLHELCSDKFRTADDVEIDVSVPQETTLGDTVVVVWTVTNTNKSEKRSCEFYMSSYFVTYEGTAVGECKEARGETVELQPGEETRHLTKIRADDYMDRIRPSMMFKMYLQAFVIETGQTRAFVKDVCLDTYDMLRLIVDKSAVEVGQPIALRIQISNPLKRVLQQCSLHIEGIGIPRTVILERSIRPLETTVYPTQITPTRAGLKRELVVNFSSSVLADIQKCVEIDVVAEPSNAKGELETTSNTSTK